MDILHRKLHAKDDVVYFLRSSIENPFLYLRFRGIVKDVIIEGESITYHLKTVQVHESFEDVKTHLNRVRFRVRGRKINRYLDKWTYSFDVREKTYSDDFCKKYANYLFDVPSLLVFETRDELETNLNKLNKKILNDLNRYTHFVKVRTNEY
ncbi:gp268 [Sphingomonas phage PAU]|uniref:gp268 n=1 Tax=Sphingomonas phage PAU TaxID=1150991 RepID=UPI0002573412|nr:gp268 [Sphingomonas phage PAU]AFF28266.1 gp268 [Sphingomonas phage PAU]